jgi:hypothetical protein
MGALFAPLGLVALVYGHKRKGSKGVILLVILSFAVVTGMTLSGCDQPTPTPTNPTDPTQPPSETPTPSDPTQTPSPTSDPGAPTDTPTPDCLKNWRPDKFKISHYAIVQENDPFFTPNDQSWSNQVPIESGNNTALMSVPVFRFYVGNAKSNTCDENCKNWSVLFQGAGMLTESASLSMSNGKRYVQADDHNKPVFYGYQFDAAYYFVDEPFGACGSGYPLVADATLAVPKGELGYSAADGKPFTCGDKYYIEGFGDTIFTVKDTGSFVNENGQEHFDIFVGAQTNYAYKNNAKYQESDGDDRNVAKVQP